MECKAILSRSTTDQIKSKILSPELSQLVFDVYITPTEFSKLIELNYEREFTLSISTPGGNAES